MANISILLIEGTPAKPQDISDVLRRAGYGVKHIPCDSNDTSSSATETHVQAKNALARLASLSLLVDETTEPSQAPLVIITNKHNRESIASKGLLYLDDLQLNRLTHQAYVHNKVMDLTSIQFSLLHAFLENRGAVMSKAILYQSVLNRELGPHDRSLDMHLSRLRRKLTDFGWQGERLKTIHGKGYCLT
tara:strand:- start:2879 stop:3448 length:570 start_codon:yes stop_codon:yes gene_type:complete